MIKCYILVPFVKGIVEDPESCVDRNIWAFDGTVDCDTLVKETTYGMHKDPDYWCNEYSQTDCCDTCEALREVL